jgi:hypothetical protein
VGWVTEQINQFATATSRTLRVLDDRMRALEDDFDTQRVPASPVLETGWAHGPGAWWVEPVLASLRGQGGRIVHAAAGDGWLVRRMAAAGLDAYGVEPREGRIDRAEVEGLDLREEPVLEHLRAVAPDGLGALVLTGVVDGMSPAERDAVVTLAAHMVAPGGRLIIHSLSAAAWDSNDAPVEADLAPGRPLRPSTWAALLGRVGFRVDVVEGPESLDYLVLTVSDWGGEGDGSTR